MDFLDELELLAQGAIHQPDPYAEPSDGDIARWQHLFGYVPFEARQKIQAHRSDLGGITISDMHWDMIRVEKESEGCP